MTCFVMLEATIYHIHTDIHTHTEKKVNLFFFQLNKNKVMNSFQYEMEFCDENSEEKNCMSNHDLFEPICECISSYGYVDFFFW